MFAERNAVDFSFKSIEEVRSAYEFSRLQDMKDNVIAIADALDLTKHQIATLESYLSA